MAARLHAIGAPQPLRAGAFVAAALAVLVLGTLAAVAFEARGLSRLGPWDVRAVWFTIWQAAVSATLSALLAIPVARALARRRFLGRHLLILLLGACGNQPEATGPERKTAAGEVLGGSISDAMLPLDTVQSQSPPLQESPAVDGDTAGKDAQPVGRDKPAAGAKLDESNDPATRPADR